MSIRSLHLKFIEGIEMKWFGSYCFDAGDKVVAGGCLLVMFV